MKLTIDNTENGIVSFNADNNLPINGESNITFANSDVAVLDINNLAKADLTIYGESTLYNNVKFIVRSDTNIRDISFNGNNLNFIVEAGKTLSFTNFISLEHNLESDLSSVGNISFHGAGGTINFNSDISINGTIDVSFNHSGFINIKNNAEVAFKGNIGTEPFHLDILQIGSHSDTGTAVFKSGEYHYIDTIKIHPNSALIIENGVKVFGYIDNNGGTVIDNNETPLNGDVLDEVV